MHGTVAPGFDALIESFPSEIFAATTDTIYGVWADFRLAYFNEAWERFALENGAPDTLSTEEYLGTSVVDVAPPGLRPFYIHLYERSLSRDEVLTETAPLRHRYECSSPTLFREFVMTLYPLGEAEGVLVVNSLVTEMSHAIRGLVPFEPIESFYLDEKGLIRQCAHCRRTKNLAVRGRWDWVPEWVDAPPPNVTQTVCAFCAEKYVPPAAVLMAP